MTTSIPATPNDISAAGSTGGSVATALLDALAGAPGSTGGATCPLNFLQLLGAPMTPAAATAPAAAGTVPTSDLTTTTTVNPAANPLASMPLPSNCRAMAAATAADAMDATDATEGTADVSAAATPTRDQLEAAAALLAPLLQMLQALPLASVAAGATPPALTVQIGNQPPAAVPLPANLFAPNAGQGSVSGGAIAAGATATVSTTTDPASTTAIADDAGNGNPATNASAAGLIQDFAARIAAALDLKSVTTTTTADAAIPAVSPDPAPDAAISTALTAGPAAKSNPTTGTPVPTATSSDSPTAVLSAEVSLPAGGLLRARLTLPRSTVPAAFTTAVGRTEKIAASPGSIPAASALENPAREKNFLTPAIKQVAESDQKDGTSVALPASEMTATLFERQSAAEKALSFSFSDRPEFAVGAQTQTENLAPESLAHRAVAAVVSAVEAQTVSRLQPVPSVHLKLNIGGEDLGIKVQLRDGQVRTEFQTASPELRSAIAREWQSVGVESPTRVLRYLEPVYSASNPGDQNASSFGQQGQSSQQYGRPSAQDVFGTVGRAYPFRETEGEMVAPAALPVFQPTSLHLSAVA